MVQPKIKLEKVENFWRSNKRHLRTTIHHKSTSKLPSKNTRISRTPLQKRPQNSQNGSPAPQIFLVKFEPKKPSPTRSSSPPG
jgi:hypothetical protein